MSLFIVVVCCVRCLPHTKTEHSVLEVVSHAFIVIFLIDPVMCLQSNKSTVDSFMEWYGEWCVVTMFAFLKGTVVLLK